MVIASNISDSVNNISMAKLTISSLWLFSFQSTIQGFPITIETTTIIIAYEWFWILFPGNWLQQLLRRTNCYGIVNKINNLKAS